jgi:hypothetical protein
VCTLARKVSATREVLEVEELLFFEAMHGFQVALVGVGGGRDAHMPTVTAGVGTSALNSPPLSVCQTKSQRDAVGIEVPLGTEGKLPLTGALPSSPHSREANAIAAFHG